MQNPQPTLTPQAPPSPTAMARRPPLPNIRWWVIMPLLVASTMLNHLDRNVLSQAAPVLKIKLGIDEVGLSHIAIVFAFFYMIMHLGAGRIIDWLGSRRGFGLAVFFWSIANTLHCLATGLRSMTFFRGMLAVGEGGNYPAVAKTVAEWYPVRERSVATGLMNFGAGFGGIAAPILTSYLIIYFSWQAPFVVTGCLGFLWVFMWLRFYRPPEAHPWISPEELALIHADREDLQLQGKSGSEGVWGEVLTSRNIWAVSIARFFTEQPWSFFVVWIPTYLSTQRHLNIKEIGLYGWMPFLAADLGCLFGGYLSPFFRRLGFSLLMARKLALTVPCLTMIGILFVFRAPNVYWALFYFCIGTFSHQAICATLLSLPADLMPKRAVATSLGLTGSMGFLGVMLLNYLVGPQAKAGNYGPILMSLAFLDVIAAAVVWALVWPPKNIR